MGKSYRVRPSSRAAVANSEAAAGVLPCRREGGVQLVAPRQSDGAKDRISRGNLGGVFLASTGRLSGLIASSSCPYGNNIKNDFKACLYGPGLGSHQIILEMQLQALHWDGLEGPKGRPSWVSDRLGSEGISASAVFLRTADWYSPHHIPGCS